jgi:hypothetical protein
MAGGRMSPDVVVLLPTAPGGADPWIDGAAEAARRLAGLGMTVDVRVGFPERLPAAGVTVCHGVQYEPLLAGGAAAPVIVSDLLSTGAAGPVTMIDWCWADAAADAARFAAERGFRRLGFVAGPPVPTQRRVVAEFAEAAAAPVSVVHLPAFDDVDAGRAAGALLTDEFGCDLVAHAADAGGVAATRIARIRGATTFGFLSPDPDDHGWIGSDIAGALTTLATRALAGERLPQRFDADLASGFGGFQRRIDFGDVTLV